VIKALKGPMRVAPEDPGGRIAQNEGLAVNAVAADEPLPADPNRVVLAPKPLALTPADTAPEATAPAAPTDPANPATVTPDAATAAPVPESSDPIGDALNAARNAAGPATSDLAIAASPRPMLRPAGLTLPAAAPVTPAAPKVTEVDAATLTPGTRLVQLGAYPDADAARAAWMQLTERFDALLGEKGMVIQKAESGGRSFYRLRAAGFDGEADARSFCAALAAQNAACIPVTVR